MGYERNLTQITNEVLLLPDVRRGIEDPSNGLNSDFVRARIEEMADQIFQAASSQIESFEAEEKDIETARAELARLTAEPRDIVFIQGVGGLAFFAVVIGGPILLASQGPAAIWSWLLSLWSLQAAFALGLLISLIVAVVVRVYFYFWRSRPQLQQRLIEQLHLDTADARLAAKKETADSTVRGEVLKNVLGLIASASQPFFQDRLCVPETPDQPAPAPYKATTGRGLSEVLNSTHEVPTAVHRDLLQTFENLPGASIGICGPRGAGKSTLLWSLSSGNRKVGGRDAITVYTAAPVEYETRDFILHIFSCVCQQVLKTKGVTENRGLPFDEQHGNDLTKPLLKQQSRIGWIFVWLGASIVLLSLLFTALIWDPHAALDIVPSQPATQTSAPPGSGATAQGSSASGATSQAPKVGAASSKGFIEVMEIKPGPLLLWGAAGTLLGALLILSDQLSRLREKYGDGRPIHPLIRFIVRPPQPTAPGDPLATSAQQHLHDIRFQRSYSSGWSGALKIPAGFETGATLGTSLAQKQESLPEIVERFRNFVELITREFSRVIIGIDELDKLKSETDARKFINEIKAIFNIPNCFYLVSVSENAISNFERRGMPFRDEFDSAFDDIRHVDYLTLNGSRRLLGRRVLNLPEIFLCLCHVLSAGLPRDLIRVTRAMLDYAKINPTNNLIRDIAESLITNEVAKKVQAIEIAAREVPVEPEATAFLQQVTRLREFNPRAGRLSNHRLGRPPAKRSDLSDDDAANVRKLAELRRELDAFLYFSLTTVDFFSRYENEQEWQEVIRLGLVDRLGEARQAFELNVGVAEFRLEELRRSCDMLKVQRRRTKARRSKKPRPTKKKRRAA